MWPVFASSVLLIICACLWSAVFDRWLHFCIATFQSHTWLIWILPIFGALICAAQNRGWLRWTRLDQLLKNHTDAKISTPFWIVLLSGFSQFFGASTGREGTSLLYSLELSNLLIHRLNLQNYDRFLRRLGVAVGFSSLFLLPLGGLAASFELLPKDVHESKPRFFFEFVAVTFASFLASFFSGFLGLNRLQLGIFEWDFSKLDLTFVKQFILVTLIVFVMSQAYILIFRRFATKNVIVSFLMLLAFAIFSFFTQFRWNGFGLELLQLKFADLGDGVLKLFATLVSTASGVKGGEVTPLLVGGALTGLFFSPVFSQITAIVMFSSILGIPLTALAVGFDFFGTYGAIWCGLMTFIVYRLNRRQGLWRF